MTQEERDQREKKYFESFGFDDEPFDPMQYEFGAIQEESPHALVVIKAVVQIARPTNTRFQVYDSGLMQEDDR